MKVLNYVQPFNPVTKVIIRQMIQKKKNLQLIENIINNFVRQKALSDSLI